MVQQTTSERKITMQISNLFIPEIIRLQKHIVISWCEDMASCETNCFLFYKDADGCGDFKRESELVPLSKCNVDQETITRSFHLPHWSPESTQSRIFLFLEAPPMGILAREWGVRGEGWGVRGEGWGVKGEGWGMGARGEGWGRGVRGEGRRWTVVFPPFSVYKYCSVSFLQNIRFLLSFSHCL